ncbi:MAG: acetylxylan esterase [Terriglobia bacterium]|jgi:dienelactone hydrolase
MEDRSRRDFLSGVGSVLAAGLAPAGAKGYASEAGEKARIADLPASDARDLPSGDRRLEVRTLDTPRVPPSFKSRAAWEARAAKLREQILVAAGLWPLPEKTPLRAQVFDRIDQEGYSVEKVHFESHPRFYCTGNLYRPLGGSAAPPFPGVLCPHGHWNYGRLEHNPDDPNGCSVPARCVNFALQGFVAFAYDMVGYNDSFQVPHNWGRDMKAPWTLSQEALRLGLWGVGLLGLHLWNSIRAIDFLSSLPDVDSQRIAVTGASGGGTQTFLLTAVDERVRVAAPVNMISHFMQGGDICENAPNLRIDTDNVEIGAVAAPRPMLMVSATGDWTCDTPRVEYPAIRAIYGLFDEPARVTCVQIPAQHNYNRLSREAVYEFFARWLRKDAIKTSAEAPKEKDQDFSLDPGRLLVFNRRQVPAEALDPQRLADYLVAGTRQRLEKSVPQNAAELESYRKKFGPSFRVALMAASPTADDLRWWTLPVGAAGGNEPRRRLIIGRSSVQDRISAQLVVPPTRITSAAMVVHPQGAEAALGSPQGPTPLAQELEKHGYLLFSVDAFQTGEAADSSRRMDGPYFSTYNRTDDAQRVQDILTGLVYLKEIWRPNRIVIVGQGLAGLWSLLARPFFRTPFALVADVAGFDGGDDGAYLERLHIPLLRQAGDFQTAALLAPPSPLLLHNLGTHFSSEPFEHSFKVQGAPNRLRVSTQELSASEIAAWITEDSHC